MSLVNSIVEGELLEGIIEWTKIASPTFEVASVNMMMAKACVDTERAGLHVMRVSGTKYGDVVFARRPDENGNTGGGILVLGHLDTVQCAESMGASLSVAVEGEKVYGPGIYDMKGGMRAALYGLEVLSRAKLRPKLPVTFMFISDEEIGSPSTRHLIEGEAKNQKYVLVPEPSHDGRIVSGRHAFLRYNIVARGRPAHAGVNNRDGKSAVRAMAELIEQIERFSNFERGETYSVGVVHGGLFVNVIPTICRAEVLCVAPDEESYGRVQARMRALSGPRDGGVIIEVEPGPTRPLFVANSGTIALFNRAEAIAKQINFPLAHGQFGGGSDGNFTGAMGIPTLDGLGVDGAGLHTPGEYMTTRTLVPRCFVLAELLRTLD